MKIKITLLVLLTQFLWINTIVSQSPICSINDILNQVKEYQTSDDLLRNGRIYQPFMEKSKGHRYFKYEDFQTGSIFIKGKTYSNIPIRYQLKPEELIIKTKVYGIGYIYLQLNKEIIDSFQINTDSFIKVDTLKRVFAHKQENNLLYIYKIGSSEFMKKGVKFINFFEKKPIIFKQEITMNEIGAKKAEILVDHVRSNEDIPCGFDSILTYLSKSQHTDDILRNGTVYQPRTHKQESQLSFGKNEFYKSIIYLKDKTFKNIELKYNLMPEELIIKSNVFGIGKVLIKINSNDIDSFDIINHRFIKIDRPKHKYGERIYTGSFDVYLSHNLLKKKKIKEKRKLVVYKKASPSLYLKDDNVFLEVTNEYILTKYFSKEQKMLKNKLKSIKGNLNDASNNKLHEFFNYIDSIRII